jgi:hypothetical protein
VRSKGSLGRSLSSKCLMHTISCCRPSETRKLARGSDRVTGLLDLWRERQRISNPINARYRVSPGFPSFEIDLDMGQFLMAREYRSRVLAAMRGKLFTLEAPLIYSMKFVADPPYTKP